MEDLSKHGTRIYGERARNIAALYCIRRTWTRWQRFLWWLAFVTPFEFSIIMSRDRRGLYLMRAVLWPRPSQVIEGVAKRLYNTPSVAWRLYTSLLLFWLAPKLQWLPPVFLHYAFAADTEYEQHNHPWPALSLILSRGYVEERSDRGGRYPIKRKPGHVVRLERYTYHRILTSGWFSLFVPFKRRPGPEDESWGFKDPETGNYWNWVEYSRLKGGRL